MSKAAYSDLKAAWHLDAIATLRNGGQIVPRQVQLIISDLCNHDCHFCAYRSSAGFSSEQFGEDTGKGFTMNPNRKIETWKCKEILDDCSAMGVKAIQFTGGGEPTVHPDHLEVFAHAQALGMQTSLVTNGALLRSGWHEVLPPMSWIRVSVDAGSADTYARVRRVSPRTYYKVLDNISQIRDRLEAVKSKCLLGAGYVVTRENWMEIASGCKALKNAGAPYVRLAGMFSTAGDEYYDGLHDEIRREIAKAVNLTGNGFKVVNLFDDRVSDLRQAAPDYTFCGYQQFNVYIGGNLKVYRCCTTSYTQHGEVGDLSNKRFVDWSNSEAKMRRYAEFDARTCNICQFNGKNRVINYLVDDKPVHVDFV